MHTLGPGTCLSFDCSGSGMSPLLASPVPLIVQQLRGGRNGLNLSAPVTLPRPPLLHCPSLSTSQFHSPGTFSLLESVSRGLITGRPLLPPLPPGGDSRPEVGALEGINGHDTISHLACSKTLAPLPPTPLSLVPRRLESGWLCDSLLPKRKRPKRHHTCWTRKDDKPSTLLAGAQRRPCCEEA